jgi:hypothetical protein
MVFRKRCVLALLGIVLSVLAINSAAQNSSSDEDDYDDESSVRYAYLSLHLDSEGAADVNLTLDRKPELAFLAVPRTERTLPSAHCHL